MQAFTVHKKLCHMKLYKKIAKNKGYVTKGCIAFGFLLFKDVPTAIITTSTIAP